MTECSNAAPGNPTRMIRTLLLLLKAGKPGKPFVGG